MKILVVGSGGREHTLAWKLAQSQKIQKVYIAPGNAGTALEAKCENIATANDQASSDGQEELKEFALKEKIDMTIIGPELPLAMGIADNFREAGLAVIGPGKQAAQLESSKIYSKEFMAKYGVRTAKSKSFTTAETAIKYASDHFNAAKALPLVIKADGLAAGKGVIIAKDFTEAEEAIVSLMKNKSLGDAGNSVLLEEFLDGKEVSILAAVSKDYILPFISARDHKARFDGGKGPNTGGMGAIAPVPDFSASLQDDFVKSILEPTLKGIKAEGFDYRGFIFFGLMLVENRCYLLEYNVRLGDPETQAVLPLMDFDLADLCEAILEGSEFPLSWKAGAVCAPVAVADGYPGDYRKGDQISVNVPELEKTGAKVFISGAKTIEGYAMQTSGGRVLTVSAYGKNLEEARANAYKGLSHISFEGMGVRSDIGGSCKTETLAKQ